MFSFVCVVWLFCLVFVVGHCLRVQGVCVDVCCVVVCGMCCFVSVYGLVRSLLLFLCCCSLCVWFVVVVYCFGFGLRDVFAVVDVCWCLN